MMFAEAESGAVVRFSDLLDLVGEFSTIVADPPWEVSTGPKRESGPASSLATETADEHRVDTPRKAE